MGVGALPAPAGDGRRSSAQRGAPHRAPGSHAGTVLSLVVCTRAQNPTRRGWKL